MPGAPSRTIQELGGHPELGMTQRYMHLSPAALNSAIRLLDQPFSVQTLGDIFETRRVSEERSIGRLDGGQFEPCAGLGKDNFRDSFGDSRVPATQSLAYT